MTYSCECVSPGSRRSGTHGIIGRFQSSSGEAETWPNRLPCRMESVTGVVLPSGRLVFAPA